MNQLEMMEAGLVEELPHLSVHLIREMRLKEQNLDDLKRIQKVIEIEEDQFMSTEEVLNRILNFYNKFVPFREQ